MVTQGALGCWSLAEWFSLKASYAAPVRWQGPWLSEDPSGCLKVHPRQLLHISFQHATETDRTTGYWVGIFPSSCVAFRGLQCVSSQPGGSAWSGFLHDSWFLPEHVFQETRAELQGFLWPSLSSHTGPLPLTSLGYTGQPRFSMEGVYRTAWMPRGAVHLETIFEAWLTYSPLFPSLWSHRKHVHSHLCIPLRALPLFLFLCPCSTVSDFGWLVCLVIFEPSVPGLVPDPHQTQISVGLN